MGTITSFKDLDVWRVAMDLTVHLYGLIRTLPAEERFELAGQMRRAAVSVPSNVAEGHACQLRRRYRHHVHIALGSTAELMTDVEVGRRLGYWSDVTAQELDKELTRVTKLLHGVRRDINRQLALDGAKAVFFIACFWLATH